METNNAELFKKATVVCMKWLADKGYHVENIEYLDGYFIYDFGQNSVIHYNIKECPGWDFGIWWTAGDNYIMGDFFCEHKELVDKFKPSQCEYCKTIKFEEQDFESEYIDLNFRCDWVNIIDFISKHPIKAWYKSYFSVDFNTKHISSLTMLKEYLNFRKFRATKKFLNHCFEKSETKFIRKYVLPLCDWDEEHKAKLIDMGDNCSPKYEIQCMVPDSAGEDGIGCFDIFETKDDAIKIRWKKLVKRHEKISDIFQFFRVRVCDDCVVYWRKCDWEDNDERL